MDLFLSRPLKSDTNLKTEYTNSRSSPRREFNTLAAIARTSPFQVLPLTLAVHPRFSPRRDRRQPGASFPARCPQVTIPRILCHCLSPHRSSSSRSRTKRKVSHSPVLMRLAEHSPLRGTRAPGNWGSGGTGIPGEQGFPGQLGRGSSALQGPGQALRQAAPQPDGRAGV